MAPGRERGPAGLADLPSAVSTPSAFPGNISAERGWGHYLVPLPDLCRPERRESSLSTSPSRLRWSWTWQSQDFQMHMQLVFQELHEVQCFHTTQAVFHLSVFWGHSEEGRKARSQLFGSSPKQLPSEQPYLYLFSRLVFHEMKL